MTVYRPKGRNTGGAMLVLPGGGFEVVALDLEGTEICDWVVQQGNDLRGAEISRAAGLAQ